MLTEKRTRKEIIDKRLQLAGWDVTNNMQVVEGRKRINDYIRYGRVFFRSMDQFYQEGTFSVKQQLVGSMFPEKLIFENKTYRTIKENPLVPLTCRPDKAFGGSKNRQTGKFAGLSNKAPQTGLEPVTL